jgi:hypothetical protein
MAERVRREVPSSPFFLSWLQSFSRATGLVKAGAGSAPPVTSSLEKTAPLWRRKRHSPRFRLWRDLAARYPLSPRGGRRARWASIADHIEETNALGPYAARRRGVAAADRRVARPSQTRIHRTSKIYRLLAQIVNIDKCVARILISRKEIDSMTVPAPLRGNILTVGECARGCAGAIS